MENRHFDHNWIGRYALNWKDSRERSDVSQYSDPPIAGAGVCDKSKEVGDDPSQEIEFPFKYIVDLALTYLWNIQFGINFCL